MYDLGIDIETQASCLLHNNFSNLQITQLGEVVTRLASFEASQNNPEVIQSLDEAKKEISLRRSNGSHIDGKALQPW